MVVFSVDAVAAVHVLAVCRKGQCKIRLHRARRHWQQETCVHPRCSSKMKLHSLVYNYVLHYRHINEVCVDLSFI